MTQAGALVIAARVLLWRCSTPTVLRLLAGGRSGPGRRGRGVATDPHQATRAVQAFGNRVRAGCLPQSIALAAVLQRGGSEPTLVLGCRYYAPKAWGAHAWVEVAGERFDPVAQPDHAELARLKAANGWQIARSGGVDGG
jgi:Transglutaminase-like superfamily